MSPTDRETVCTLAEAVEHIRDKRPRKVREAEPRCGSLVMCRCNVLACCVCVYAKANRVCSPQHEARPCRDR